MKKILYMIAILLTLSLVGCNKIMNTEKKDVTATVVKTDYEDSYSVTTFFISGKILVPTTGVYPEKYKVILEYDGVKYYLDNERYYNICKDREGKKINCKLEIYHYEDGTDKKDIIEVSETNDLR